MRMNFFFREVLLHHFHIHFHFPHFHFHHENKKVFLRKFIFAPLSHFLRCKISSSLLLSSPHNLASLSFRGIIFWSQLFQFLSRHAASASISLLISSLQRSAFSEQCPQRIPFFVSYSQSNSSFFYQLKLCQLNKMRTDRHFSISLLHVE